MPDEVSLASSDWKDLAIPLTQKNDTKKCKESRKLEYDKCHLYDVNYVELLQKYQGNLNANLSTIQSKTNTLLYKLTVFILCFIAF